MGEAEREDEGGFAIGDNWEEGTHVRGVRRGRFCEAFNLRSPPSWYELQLNTQLSGVPLPDALMQAPPPSVPTFSPAHYGSCWQIVHVRGSTSASTYRKV